MKGSMAKRLLCSVAFLLCSLNDVSFADTGAWQQISPLSGPGKFNLNNCKLLAMADVDLDGRPDVVCAYDYGGSRTRTFVRFIHADGATAWTAWGPELEQFDLNACRMLTIADVNGDGVPDLVCAYDYGNSNTATWVQLLKRDGASAWKMWSPPSGPGKFNLSNCKLLAMADVDLDGRPDVVCAYDYGGSRTRTFVQFIHADGATAWTAWGPELEQFNLTACRMLTIADVNGDAVPDLVCVYDYGDSNTATWVQLLKRDGASAWKMWSPPSGPGKFDVGRCRLLTVADTNRDGLLDVVCAYDYGNSNTATFVSLGIK